MGVGFGIFWVPSGSLEQPLKSPTNSFLPAGLHVEEDFVSLFQPGGRNACDPGG